MKHDIFRHKHLGAPLQRFFNVQAFAVYIGANPMHLVGGQKAILNALAQTVAIRRFAGLTFIFYFNGRLFGTKVGVGVDIFILLGRGRHPQMNGAAKVIQDFFPSAPARTMGFVDDDQIEKVGGELFKNALPLAFLTPQVVVNGEVQVTIQAQFLFAIEQKAGIAGAGGKGAKGVVGAVLYLELPEVGRRRTAADCVVGLRHLWHSKSAVIHQSDAQNQLDLVVHLNLH